MTYVADWDAKGRSNDEEETMRSQWTDKVNGRVINLNNYSFSEMSGWGGFRFDWSSWPSDIDLEGGEVVKKKNKITVKNFGPKPTYTLLNRSGNALNGVLPSFIFRVTGLKPGASLTFYGHPTTGDNFFLTTVRSDGIYSVPEDLRNPAYYAFTATGYSANEAANLVIEQLPVYPGALMSDGVDDYGHASKTISDMVGTVICHTHPIQTESSGYVYGSEWKKGGVFLYINNKGLIVSGDTGKDESVTTKTNTIAIDDLYTMTRDPAVINNLLQISRLSGTAVSEYGKNALFRLILIKEQLDDAQVEFLKWKVEKEYRDWCRENGYEYAINEMLNN